MIDLASLLIYLRESRGLSVRAAAKQMGISNPYLSQLETGKISNPTLDVIQRISRVYRIKGDMWLKVRTEPGSMSALRAKRPSPQNGNGDV